MKGIGKIVLVALLVTTCVVGLSACKQETKKQGFETTSVNDSQKTQTTPTPTPVPTQAATAQTTTTATVAIDAGHQGKADSAQEPIGPGASETKARVAGGATSVTTGTPESEVNLAVALKLQSALATRGINVVMVRTTEDVDISNAERAAIANDANADLFIRLHCDGVDSSSTNGFLTLVPGSNSYTAAIAAQSQAAGDIMHPVIVSETGANDRGIVERTDLSGFNWCTVPTVLFEMGCMSNPTEDAKLNSDAYQQTLANAIADATVTYLNSR